MSFGLRRILIAGLFATATVSLTSLSLTSPTAHAASPTTLVNGLLSTVGGCQSASYDAIVRCTNWETLTPEFPVMLDINPFGTNIVVLGAGLLPDGAIRPVLESRLNAALRLARRYPLTPIVVSGGVPQSGVTEARAMNDWLVARGVFPFRITQEDTSRSTVENAANTNRILAARGATGIVVVTSPDHLHRAMIDFRVAAAGRFPVAGVVAP